MYLDNFKYNIGLNLIAGTMGGRYLLIALILISLIPVIDASSVGFQLPEREEFIYSWSTIAGRYTIDVDKEGIDFTEIRFNYKDTQTNARLTIFPKEANPVNDTPIGDVYKYLEIETVRIRDIMVADAIIRFRVDNTWLGPRNTEDMILMRYSNGVWGELNTTFLESDFDYYYFESETPGFSYFAIVLKEAPVEEIVEEPEEPEEVLEKIVVDEEPRKEVSMTFVGASVLIVLLIIVGWFFVKKYKKKLF